MVFLVKVPLSIVSVSAFDNLTFKRMIALKNDSFCRQLFSKLLFLATCNLKHILTLILRIKLL